MPIWNRAIALAALLLLCCASRANSSAWLGRAWQTDEGLLDNNVVGVAQVGGYLWVATWGGFASFDGARFRELSLVTLASAPNRVVRAMCRDGETLWLGMDRGPVVQLSRNESKTFRTEDGLPDYNMTVMAADASGIWIAYEGREGLGRIRNGKAEFVREVTGAPKGGSWWLASDAAGTVWFAKGDSVGILKDEVAQPRFEFEGGRPRIGAGRDGGVWIFGNSRLYRANAKDTEAREIGAMKEPRGAQASVLFEDSEGAVWIGTIADGLYRYANGFESVPTSHRAITSLAEDSEGNVWAGAAGGGLNRLRPRTVELLTPESGLPFEAIRSSCEDSEGRVWIATQNGMLARQDGRGWKVISAESGWLGGLATCVAGDPRGGIWVGTEDVGIRRYDNGQFTPFGKRNGLASHFVRALMATPRGDLWIGLDSPNVVQRLREGRIETFELPQPARLIRAMAEDASGAIWVGTSEGQLLRLRGEKFETFPTGIAPHSIRSLASTPDGSVWIGYAGMPLGRVKESELARLPNGSGMHDWFVSQIVPDGRGWLWFGANRGIFQVRLESLNDLFEGKRDRLRSIVYGRGEGLPSLQASFDFFPTGFRGRDGRLWMPMRTGLAVIRPDKIRDNPNPPEVVIEAALVDPASTPVDAATGAPQGPAWPKFLARESGGLRVPPRHQKIDFQFTALSFTAPENVHFRYKLEGVDVDWVDAGAVRRASYPLLPARDYKFVVTACNNVGVWNETGATFAFTVLPFFWQTWWFRISAISVFSIGLVALARFIFLRRAHAQLRALEAQTALHKERARIAKDIHDDLGASLTQIALLTELARHDSEQREKTDEYFSKIAGAARAVVKSLDEIVWAVNPRNDTLADFIDYTAQFALDYLALAGIRCRLDLPEPAPARDLPADLRHNLFLAAKEALHNVVKHSHASEVWLRVKLEDENLRIEVEDNGRGFEGAPDRAWSDGLRNMANRLKDVGGQCEVESGAGGVRVSIRVPAPKAAAK